LRHYVHGLGGGGGFTADERIATEVAVSNPGTAAAEQTVLLTCEKPYGYFWPANKEEGETLSGIATFACEERFYNAADIKVGLGCTAQAEKIKFEGF